MRVHQVPGWIVYHTIRPRANEPFAQTTRGIVLQLLRNCGVAPGIGYGSLVNQIPSRVVSAAICLDEPSDRRGVGRVGTAAVEGVMAGRAGIHRLNNLIRGVEEDSYLARCIPTDRMYNRSVSADPVREMLDEIRR